MARSPLFRALRRAFAVSSRAGELGAPAPELLESLDAREKTLTRRDFLAASAAAAGGLLAGLPRRAFAAPAQPVAILGAGVSGLTAAYRLEQAGVPWVLYEASARHGGRMFTKDQFNEDGMFCELGGELVDTDHRFAHALARELGLELQSLKPAALGVSRNLYWFKGRAYTDAQLAASVGPLVEAVNRDLKVIYGGKERRPVTYKEPFNAARWDKMTLREYFDSLRGVDDWVRGAVEMAYLTEYGLDTERQSALNLHLLVSTSVGPGDFELFGESDEAFRVVGGSQRLTDALGRRLGLRDAGTARYKPRHELASISEAGSGLRLAFSTPGGTVEATASRVVCTIPFSVLRGIDGVRALDLRPQKKAAIRSMPYGTNSKLMLGFKDRWWRTGESGAPKSNGGLFADLPGQSYWETSRMQRGARGIITNYTGGTVGLARDRDKVGESLSDMDTVFPGLKARFDGNTALFNWGRYRHNLGSYICPGPGDYTSTFGAAGETECGGRLLFAGEHASVDGCGYMNGGIQAGETAARELLASLSVAR
jgi:monoamine oxidase